MSFSIDAIQQLGLNAAEVISPKKQELGQDQFLKLMTAQLTHQDPTKPMENGDFLGQMAQFSTVEGIGDLQQSFQAFASSMTSSQALEASGLVGRSVAIPSEQGVLSLNEPLSGSLQLDKATDHAVVNIIDQNGEIMKTLDLGNQSAGVTHFQWDGMRNDGSYATPGVYTIEAQATIDGENTAVKTLVSATVESVDLGNAQRGVILNLGQLGRVEFSQVKQVF